LSSADIFRTKGEGFFRCGRPHFLAQKTLDFLKFIVCPHGQGGGRSGQCGQGVGSIFRDFVRTSFMDGPLAISIK